MSDTSVRRNALKTQIDLATAEIDKGGLSRNRISTLRGVIAAARRALHDIDSRLAAGKAEAARIDRVSLLRDMYYNKHMSLQDIADEVGISRQAVSKQMGKVGHRSMTVFQQQCLELRQDGKSIQEIADKLSRPYKSVWRALDRLDALDKRSYTKSK